MNRSDKDDEPWRRSSLKAGKSAMEKDARRKRKQIFLVANLWGETFHRLLEVCLVAATRDFSILLSYIDWVAVDERIENSGLSQYMHHRHNSCPNCLEVFSRRSSHIKISLALWTSILHLSFPFSFFVEICDLSQGESLFRCVLKYTI